MRLKAKLFTQALCDETQLALDAKQQLAEYTTLPPSAKEILELSQQYSADLAARTFYEGLLQSSHNSFYQRLNHYSTRIIKHQKKIKIMLIPGMFYKEHPETGANGQLVVNIAQKFGFAVECIDIHSCGSVSANSQLIAKKIIEDQHPNIWLISISKGSCEVRHFLQHHQLNPNIKGWINIAGIHKGLPYLDARLNNPVKKLWLKVLCRLFAVDYQALLELQTTHPYWAVDQWPADIEMIHIVPIPHSSHIQQKLSQKYYKTLSHGPNDGLTPITDILDLPGHIYPVWGCDHFMRISAMSTYLYQLFNYIADAQQELNRVQP